MRGMQVLHVTTFLQGGAGRIIVSLAIAQRRAGHDVRVIADAGGEPGYMTYPEYVTALDAAGVPLLRVRSTFKRDPALTRSAAHQLRQLAAAWRPDVVHAHAAMPAVVARAAGLCGQPGTARLVQTMHGWGVAKTPAQAAHDLAVLAAADALVTPSRAARDGLVAAGLRRRDVHVIPYGIEPAAAGAPDPNDVALLRTRAAGPVVLCIGTIGDRKNQRLLVDALARSRSKRVTAVFVGDGDSAGLRAYAVERDVASRVIVLGHRAAADRYLSLAAALVLPSKNEGLPLAVLEALRAGVPVVATALPEIAEAVGHANAGFLVPPDDADALADAVERAVSVPHRERLARRLRRRFAARFTAERMHAAYERLYFAEADTAFGAVTSSSPAHFAAH